MPGRERRVGELDELARLLGEPRAGRGATEPRAGSTVPDVPRRHAPSDVPGTLTQRYASTSTVPTGSTSTVPTPTVPTPTVPAGPTPSVGRAPAPRPGGLHHASASAPSANPPAGGVHGPRPLREVSTTRCGASAGSRAIPAAAYASSYQDVAAPGQSVTCTPPRRARSTHALTRAPNATSSAVVR
ncbi:hypothetical protein CLV28_0392 [Sediminihabitans luteus]|uniref:Uncharacterized protein n=1 Tax=Sediminihabitans luteus TaxID=1138585 RepID=A0A2M9CZL0_9CELL|nr:hypothetical protein CLV28_0392 [Sediminihabitans luteus]GII98626.1 hypothetical protein Slu03_10040 [Sediminihabitans luteus]